MHKKTPPLRLGSVQRCRRFLTPFLESGKNTERAGGLARPRLGTYSCGSAPDFDQKAVTGFAIVPSHPGGGHPIWLPIRLSPPMVTPNGPIQVTSVGPDAVQARSERLPLAAPRGLQRPMPQSRRT